MTTLFTSDVVYLARREPDPTAAAPDDPSAFVESRSVEIRDGRTAALPGWKDCGFELVEHPSAVTDWDDDDEVARIHHPELEALAAAMTGADHALVSSHIRRNPAAAAGVHEQLAPIPFAHSDFAAGHEEFIRRLYSNGAPGPAGALARHGLDATAVTEARRIVILQFWRNLGPAKMDYPLAFCDIGSVSIDQGRAIRVENYAGTGATFDALAMTAPADDEPPHRWYVFPEMRPDETVAFRTYDTDLVERGDIYFTPHCAVRDPEVPVGAPARSSIELRATCIFT